MICLDNVAFTVAVVTAISAVLSPILTAIINNIHATRMRKMELFTSKRISVINQFVADVGECLAAVNYDEEEEDRFSASLCAVFLYAPKSIWQDLDTFIVLLRSGDKNKAKEQFPDITKKLSSSVTKLII